MKHILLEDYKKELVDLCETVPDQKAPLNLKRLLVASGFFNEEKATRQKKENKVPYLKQHTKNFIKERVNSND